MEEFLNFLLIGLIILTVFGLLTVRVGMFDWTGKVEYIGKMSASIGSVGLIIFFIFKFIFA